MEKVRNGLPQVAQHRPENLFDENRAAFPAVKRFYDFSGRGDTSIPFDKYHLLEPDPGAVLLVTQICGKAEFIICYCRSAIVEKWGCYCFESFRRASDICFTRCWAEPTESDLMIYRAVTVYLVAEEEWMGRSG